MKRIGLSGGIACGKSSVANILRSKGIPVVDADQVARDIVKPGTAALSELVQEFGKDILKSSGYLNRKKLGSIVMNDPEKRASLNSITHPKIRNSIFSTLQEWHKEGQQAGVVEAALMVETKSYTLYDALIIVTCAPGVQIKRLMNREGFDQQTAQTWINSQLPLSEKEKVADVVIDNSADKETLKKLVHDAWNKLINQLD